MFTEQNPFWSEIFIAVHMPSMNHSSLSSYWNSKYIHAIVQHSAISSGFEYPLWHNVPINTNIMLIKITVNYIPHEILITHVIN
jgi:hypothetical protein